MYSYHILLHISAPGIPASEDHLADGIGIILQIECVLY